MSQPDSDKLYSDPSDQRTLADALSSTAGPYSTENLVSALKAKDKQKDPAANIRVPVSASPMQPWALDAPPQAPAPPPVDQRGYLERGWDALKGANSAVGNAVLHPGQTASRLWEANKAAGQSVLNANQRAGQAVLDVGKPPPPVTPQQEAEANKARLAAAQAAPQTPAADAGASAQPPPTPIQQTPAQTIGEHWVNTMDPADRALMAQGQQKELEGIQGQADPEAQALDEMARASFHGHEDDRVQQLLDKAQLDPERQKIETHNAQLQANAERNAREKVNPNRLMEHAGPGSRALMAIGLALGGFGSGLRGGPNQAMEMIKGAIDDDNRAQLQNIENSREGLKNAQGILADKMRLFGNKEQALAAARQEKLQNVASTIQDIAMQHASPKVLAAAEQLTGQVMQHHAAEGAAVQKYAAAQTVGGGPTQAQLEKEAYELVKGKDMTPADAMDAVRYLHGMQGNAPTGFYEKPGTGKADPTAVANQGLQNIEALRDAHGKLPTTSLFLQQHGGGWLPATTNGRQLDGAITQLAEIQAKATGRASPALIQQIKHTIIGNGSAADVEAGIKRARSLIQAGSATPLVGTPAAGVEKLPGEEPIQ